MRHSRGRLIEARALYDVYEVASMGRMAFTKRGAFIGDEEMARRLCEERGIDPILRRGASVCSIGRSRGDGKWYGWSHRAIAGFAVGDVVKAGDVAAEYIRPGFTARTELDARRMAEAFARSVS